MQEAMNFNDVVTVSVKGNEIIFGIRPEMMQ